MTTVEVCCRGGYTGRSSQGATNGTHAHGQKRQQITAAIEMVTTPTYFSRTGPACFGCWTTTAGGCTTCGCCWYTTWPTGCTGCCC